MAVRAADLTYGAQTRTLSANITLLDLYSSSERYAAYRKAMQFRFAGVQMPDYDAVLRSGVTPGELGCDAWLSYETKESRVDVCPHAHRARWRSFLCRPGAQPQSDD
jgi:hypothetical protein